MLVRDRRTAGITLIELAVVIAILGLLIALSAPAVQKARESARRMQCAHHLRQLGIGLNNYHAAHERFPSALPVTLDFGNGVVGGGHVYSPLVHLLPYVGNAEVYNSINFFTGPFVIASLGVNRTALARRIDGFLCPSDSSPQQGEFAPNSYRVSMGPRAGGMVGPDGPGAFDAWTWVRAAEITDGLSNTVAMSEKTPG